MDRDCTPRQSGFLASQSKLAVICWILLGIIVLYGAHIRHIVVSQTVVNNPVRADAFEYYHYAKNLKQQNMYSRESTPEPKPDALRSPGFPFFASLFFQDSTEATLKNVLSSQTILQFLCLLLLTIVIIKLLGLYWGLPAAFILWSFPHLNSINTYFLSESLFTSLLALTVFVAWLNSTKTEITDRGVMLCGFLMGLAALVRPVVEYFPLFILASTLVFSRQHLKKSLMFVLFCLLPILAWKFRNLAVLGVWSDPTLLINGIYHGSFPGFIFNNIPESFGIPYRFDPRAVEVQNGVGATLSLIGDRIQAAPMEYLSWYTYERQTYLWQWSIIAGQGDIFIYPVIKTPYAYMPDMKATHQLHYLIHNSWVVVGLISSVFIGIFSIKKKQRVHPVLLVTALFIVYAILIHIIAAPFPRYSIPYKMLLIPVSIYGFKILIQWSKGTWKKYRQSQ